MAKKKSKAKKSQPEPQDQPELHNEASQTVENGVSQQEGETDSGVGGEPLEQHSEQNGAPIEHPADTQPEEQAETAQATDTTEQNETSETAGQNEDEFVDEPIDPIDTSAQPVEPIAPAEQSSEPSEATEQAESLQSNNLPKIVTDHHQESRTSRTISVTSVPSIAKNPQQLSFIHTALTSISEFKEIKKNTELQNLIKSCLEKLNPNFDSLSIFITLRSSVETKIPEVMVLALDCLSKIFTFQFFDPIIVPSSNLKQAQAQSLDEENLANNNSKELPLIDAAIETIATAFDGEGTDERVEIQVVRALMASVLNDYMPPHGPSLLRAIRQIYNIFILSLSPVNQGIAQASLTQIVNVVFDKVEKIQSLKQAKSTTTLTTTNTDEHQQQQQDEQPLTLSNLNNLNDEQERIVDQQNSSATDENDLIIKDAFLLFRSMCKLSVKPLENESLDMRSHAVRSKLISLHIIHSIIKEHIDIFLSKDILISSPTPTRFVDVIRQYLCLSVSKNAASAISPVFEITLEIFYLIMANLRSEFKKEIPVFLFEIYFPIVEMKSSTSHQKRYFLIIIQRLCNDPRAIIEFYLNYDCDTNLPNCCEKIADYLTKLSLTRIEVTQAQKQAYIENHSNSIATYNLTQLPMLSISKLSSQVAIPDHSLPYPIDYALKLTALDCVVGLLRSLNSWAQKSLNISNSNNNLNADNISRKRSNTSNSIPESPVSSTINLDDIDDPQEFENLKQKKTALQESIRQFNFKPKKGIDLLVKNGFLPNKEPKTIAKFLLTQQGLDKAVIGEYLGDGDEFNIEIMHAFVDEMDFTNLSFVDAMRTFLQSFRLPGEAQKIDRFMLKFAERYVDGNPNIFANADTAYVLAYSVIMLNTDQHSKNVKNRMTIEDFIKNNSGIDNGNSLPDEFLIGIFNEIVNNEIKLQSEQQAALISGDLFHPQQQSFSLFGNRDLNREAYIQASKEISNKTEKLFKTLGKSSKNEKQVFYSASHVEHVKSIFDNLWMSFLASLTAPFKDFDDDDIVDTCLEGLKLSVNISSTFELDYARTSFIGALIQFSNVQNLNEIKDKNLKVISLILKIAETNGNYLKDSWKDILTLISQVERLQLIAKGIEANVLPDLTNARVHRTSMDSTRTTTSHNGFFSSFNLNKKTNLSEQAQTNHQNQTLSPEISQKLVSTDLIVSMDKVFTQSSQLNGLAIISFIKALTDVAMEEIESSVDSTTPRTFSLQKVIDVCYYNMGRIRLEWTPIWSVIGNCFNEIGTKHNSSIVFFAIDSLRQLSMRFFDIEELSGFKFQKDFLSPFDYIVKNSDNDVSVIEMVLNCLNNLILIKGTKIKSGWSTIFACLKFTSKNNHESIVKKTYMIVHSITKDHFDLVFQHESSYVELVETFRELSKNDKFQKISLHSLANIKTVISKIAERTLNKDDNSLKLDKREIFNDLWYPALFSYNDVIMTSSDLEVRSLALNQLFDDLVQFGDRFDAEFWNQISTKLLFPIFGVLSKHWEIEEFNNNNHDDFSVWLSTTLIQALRNMIALFTHYFKVLNSMLDGYLGLLISCICQENETISRVGVSCFQQLILQNMDNFTQEHWDQCSKAFNTLFESTTPNELFELDPERSMKNHASLHESQSTQNLNEQNGIDVSVEDQVSPQPQPQTKVAQILSNKQIISSRQAIVAKCILQLLLIETISELFENADFYNKIPFENLIQLADLLNSSFRFSRNFNDDYALRTRIWNTGVIDKLPNLTKQESTSAAVYIVMMFKLYRDLDKISSKQKTHISEVLIPMCVSILERYVSFDDSAQTRNVVMWRPVVVEILQGFYELEESDFIRHVPHVYDLVLSILDKSVPAELRTAMKAFFSRVGDVYIHESSEHE